MRPGHPRTLGRELVHQRRRIPLDGKIKGADGRAACEVAGRASHQKDGHAVRTGDLAHGFHRVSLGGRQAVLEQVDVISHKGSRSRLRMESIA